MNKYTHEQLINFVTRWSEILSKFDISEEQITEYAVRLEEADKLPLNPLGESVNTIMKKMYKELPLRSDKKVQEIETSETENYDSLKLLFDELEQKLESALNRIVKLETNSNRYVHPQMRRDGYCDGLRRRGGG